MILNWRVDIRIIQLKRHINIKKYMKYQHLIFAITLIIFLSCTSRSKEKEDSNYPLRYIIDTRGEKDSIIYNSEVEGGSYNIPKSRFVFYVEDGKDSIFYSSILNFESYQVSYIDKTLKNEIISVVSTLINPSNFNTNLEQGKKTLNIFVQSINSNSKIIGENAHIGGYFHYQKDLSEISQKLDQITKKLKKNPQASASVSLVQR
jgi:hypothetical protein